MTYAKTINQKMIDEILKMKEEENATPEENPLCIGPLIESASDVIKSFEKQRQFGKKLDQLLKKYSLKDVKKVHTCYYYGRSFCDGSMSDSCSFKDLHDTQKYTLDEISVKLQEVPFELLKQCFDTAREKFDAHEHNAIEAKKILKNRLKSYQKKEGKTFYNFKIQRGSSTHEIFKKVFDEFGLQETTDITTATKIIEAIIEKTKGLVAVDFLGYENFDHLQHVEANNNVLKLYWKYSVGDKENPLPPHNIRVDIVFEKLELLNYLEDRVSIALKGYYRNKKEIKHYYYNKEGVKKVHLLSEHPWSLFFTELEFDKPQRGGIENFRVTFLPWRYYNILISPKEKLPSVGATSKILIIKNMQDIQAISLLTKNEFDANPSQDEYYITMYGNRFRKIVEKLLKFVLLASQIMFKENYEKDMLGNILQQIKNHLANSSRISSPSRDGSLRKILFLMENGGLLEKLNICSHDNVQYKLDRTIVDDIDSQILQLFEHVCEFFEL